MIVYSIDKEAEMKTVTALDLRKKLGSLLNEVHEKDEQIIISRSNKPLVVMISMKDYEEKVIKKDREKRLNKIAADMDTWNKKHLKQTAGIDVVKAVREIREGK
jgi:prevent-host-death family protein